MARSKNQAVGKKSSAAADENEDAGGDVRTSRDFKKLMGTLKNREGTPPGEGRGAPSQKPKMASKGGASPKVPGLPPWSR